MGYKEQLKSILKEFNELKSYLRTEINDINKSNMYWDDNQKILFPFIK